MRVFLISANTEKINLVPLPLGLSCVARAAQNKGHDVRVMDLMFHDDWRLPIREMIAGFQPDVIGVSIRNIDDQLMSETRFLLDDIKELIPYCQSLSKAPVVLGGAGYSIFPDAVLDYLDADMGIQGEGEDVFPRLLERLERGAGLEGLQGLYLKGRGLQGERTFVRDLTDLPVDGVDRFLSGYDRSLWLPFQTRRGCPMNCSYCSTATIEGRTIRKKLPKKAVEQLKTFADAGFHQFYFVDNTFNLPASYARDLCREIIQARIDVAWRCILYPGYIDEDLIKLMSEAGCCEVSLGFESGCEHVLKNMNKHFRPEDVRKISLMLAKHGIRQMGFLMLGGPGETKESVRESLAFADSLPLDAVKVTQGIRIYPYTTLAKISVREGRIASEDHLLKPVFYMVSEMEGWLRDIIKSWIVNHPNWIT